MLRITITLCSILLCSCTVPRIVPVTVLDGKEPSVIVVLRDSAKGIGDGALYFGEGKTAWFVMNSKGKRTLTLPAGPHEFVLSTRATASYKLKVELMPNTVTCIQIEPNSVNSVGKFIFPFLRNMAPEFVASVIPCPEQVLAEYREKQNSAAPSLEP